MPQAYRNALAVGLAVLLLACGRRESLEDARARVSEASLLGQIKDVRALIARAEAGELTTQDRIAIGISEDTAKALLDASLPQEQLLGGRLHVRLESAQPVFRGNTAGVVFQASARGERTSARARLELGGRFVNYRIEAARLTASVEVVHFKVIESSLGDIGSDVLEGLVRENLQLLSGLTPSLEVPVHLEQSIEISGLDEGVVTARPGVLPLEMTLAEVIPMNQRLWVLIEAKAGPWRSVSRSDKAP